jgi:transaldolase
MTPKSSSVVYKSPLHEMTQTTPTCLWNDSAATDELKYSIEHGAVGATCNPVIVVAALKKEMSVWIDRIRALIDENPTATEDQIGWQLVREISVKSAALLKPTFDLHKEDSQSRLIRAFIAMRGPSSSRPKNSAGWRLT